MTKYFVVGGAGFIGSHLVHRVLARELAESVVVFDNFSSGHRWHLADLESDRRLVVIEGDINDGAALRSAMDGVDHVFHLAANADIAAAVSDPGIDFWSGTFLTHQVLETVRVTGVPRVTYTSGSGVYGDQGFHEVNETFGPLRPVSTYGASKLAGESLVSSYCHLFGIRGVAFRFANVVGPRQTHGIVYDLIRKLQRDATRLEVLGDGSQSKSYIHIDDVLDAVELLLPGVSEPFDVFNVGTDDYVTVAEITNIVLAVMDIEDVELVFGESPRGWKGDVPVVRFSSDKIRGLGWRNQLTSSDALRRSAEVLFLEAQAPR
jgi:UDP-glucose 4-epimerase